MRSFTTWMATLLLLSSCSTSSSAIYPFDLAPQDSLYPKAEKLNILSTVGLKLKNKSGEPVTEISGIAWDPDEKVLYGASDEGYIYHFRLNIVNKEIEGVDLLVGFALLDDEKRPLKGKWSDSEGLSLTHHNNGKTGDTELIVAFENKPRIARYRPDGELIATIRIPDNLGKRKTYRDKNKALESVTMHPLYGALTASEYPIEQDPMDIHTIYSSRGKSWRFKASEAKNSAITGLELMANGNLLVLERAWAGIRYPIVVTLSELSLNNCEGKDLCQSKTVVKMSTEEGWALDNFEGLSYFAGNQYLMISDDNRKPYQSTLLVLFEIIE